MIRGLEVADFGEIRRHAEALAVNRYQEMIPDIDRLHKLLAALRLDGSAYAKCIGPEGMPEAALLARTGDNVWATRRHSAVLLWYAIRPGLGPVLLRDYRHWALSQKTLQVAGMMDDYGMDERTIKLVERIGFERRGGALLLFPRGKHR